MKTNKKSASGLWGVYLLKCVDGTFYCGVTNDMDKRLTAHNAGKGAKYTRGRLPVTLAAFSKCRFTQGDALRQERLIKQLPQAAKVKYVKKLAKTAIKQKTTSGKSCFEEIPGVGPCMAEYFHELGFRAVSDLKKANPEEMYERLRDMRGGKIDRCVLYVFRCAVYYARTPSPDPEKLKWWNWKERA